MRYGIFSDIHANLQAFEAVISAYKKEGIDRFLCLGDIVGYGADPAECIDLARKSGADIIAGNHDWAAAERIGSENFNDNARVAMGWTIKRLGANEKFFLSNLPLVFKDNLVTCVHGTLKKPEKFAYLFTKTGAKDTFQRMEGDICFVGHTHVPRVFCYEEKRGSETEEFKPGRILLSTGKKYIFNTGSVGQPRDGNSAASYCVYDSKKKLVEIKRVSYNIAIAQDRIRKAGLPDFLAERLIHGR